MRTSVSISLVAALGLLSLSTATAAQATPAKVGVRTSGDSVIVKVTNPNRYAIKGSVALRTGARQLPSKKASVRPRKSKTLSLPAGGSTSVTVVTSFGKPGRLPKVSRRTVKLPSRSGSGSLPAPQTGGLGAGSTGITAGAGNPPPPANPHWTATDLTYGGTFGFTLVNGQITLDEPYLMDVYCQELGGQHRWAYSYERIDEYQDWARGNQSGTRQRDLPRANQYAGSSDHRVTYSVTSRQDGNQISGKVSQSFGFPRNDYGSWSTWTCSGSLSFSATRDQ